MRTKKPTQFFMNGLREPYNDKFLFFSSFIIRYFLNFWKLFYKFAFSSMAKI